MFYLGKKANLLGLYETLFMTKYADMALNLCNDTDRHLDRFHKSILPAFYQTHPFLQVMLCLWQLHEWEAPTQHFVQQYVWSALVHYPNVTAYLAIYALAWCPSLASSQSKDDIDQCHFVFYLHSLSG